MKRIKNIIITSLLLTTFVLSLFYLEGCVEASSNPPIAADKPSVKVYYPATGDTVYIGRNYVDYTADDALGGPGLDHLEIFINTVSTEHVFLPDDTLYFDIAPEAAGSMIQFYIIAYSKSGAYKQSDIQKNIYVSNAPNTPTNLTLSTFGNNSVLLLWEDNATNENNYELWRSVGNNTSYGSTPYRTLAKDQTSYSDFGLNEFVTYYYKVRAVNSSGASHFSNEVNTNGPTGRDAPTNLRGEALGASVVHLTWNDNSTRENGYLVERKNLSAGTDYAQVTVLPPNTIEYIDEGLEKNTTYQYRVAAILPSSFAYSNETTVTTGSRDITPPSNLVATFDMSARKVYLHWSDNSTLEYGSEVERKIYGSEEPFAKIGDTEPDVTTYWDSSYSAGRTYAYRVRYKTGDGSYTTYSNVDTAYVPILPPKPPKALTISTINPGTAFLLSWTDDSWDEDGFEVWKKNGEGGDYFLLKTLPANSETYTVVGLSRDSSYFFKVRSYRNNLYSEFSNEVVTPLVAPTNFNGVADNTPRVILNWSDNSGNEDYFQIQRRFAGGGTFENVGVAPPNTTQFVDNDVFRGSAYNYRMRAVNSVSASEWTDVITVTVPSKK